MSLKNKKENKKGFSYPTKLKASFKTGNYCALCRTYLVQKKRSNDTGLVGEAAHICGEKPGSARYEAGMTDEERNSSTNLIYLCPTCHVNIDAAPEDYSAEFLKKKKKEHEEWVDNRLKEGTDNFAFKELAIICNRLHSMENKNRESSFLVTYPEEKIKKNNLSIEIRNLITMGMARSADVKDFIDEMSKNDADFGEKIKLKFRYKYLDLKSKYSGDALFYELLEYTHQGTQGRKDFKLRAAGLAVLTYLFETCEIFEK